MKKTILSGHSPDFSKPRKRWHLLLSLIALVCFGQVSFAQTANDYLFTQEVGTYAPITDGTVLWSGYDGFDDQTTTVNLSSPFNYLGNTYPSIFISANGYILFGSTSTTNTPISAGRFGIAAFAVDLDAKAASANTGIPEISWKEDGDYVIFQWSNVCRYTSTGASTTENLNFQIHLNRANSEVKIVYGECVDRTSPSTTYPQVGLAGGSSTNYNNRTISAGAQGWINSLPGGSNNAATMAFNGVTVPENGLTFTWTLSSCLTPSNIAVANVRHDRATINFNAGEDDTIEVKYGPVGFNVNTDGTLVTNVSSGTVIDELTSNSSYDIYVRNVCDADNNETSPWAGPFNFFTPNPGQIGSGTSTTSDFPISTNWGYNFTQQIYTQQQVTNAVGEGNNYITSIKFFWNGTTTSTTPSGTINSTNCDDWVIYIGNTTQENFGSSTSWIPVSQMIEVFNGTVTFPAAGNWMEIEFSTPFIWDETQNIVIAVSEREQGYPGTSYFRGFTSGSNTGMYARTDTAPGTTTNPLNPGSGTRSANINQIILAAQPLPDCTPPYQLQVGSILANNVTVSWQGNAEAYEVEYGPVGYTPGTGTVVSNVTSPYVLTGLSPETNYDVYVRAICDQNTYSPWNGPRNFTTTELCPAPTAGTASNITEESATISWTSPAASFDINWGTGDFAPGQGFNLVENVSGNSLALENLQEGTIYRFYVRTNCSTEGNGTSNWAGPYTFRTLFSVIIGEGNTTTTNFPISTNWGYNYTQQIFTQAQVSAQVPAGSNFITKIRFFWNGTTSSLTAPTGTINAANCDHWVIWLGNTTQNAFDSTNSWVANGQLQQVFEGDVVFPAAGNWMEIEFDSPFIWDDTQNLVLAVSEREQGYPGTSYFRGFTSGTNSGMYVRTDTAPGASTDPLNLGTGTRANVLSQISLDAKPIPDCFPPYQLSASGMLFDRATLDWSSSGNLFDIEYGPVGFTQGTGTVINDVTAPYLLTGLSAETSYDYYVRVNCGEDGYSSWAGPFNFSTTVSCPAPSNLGHTQQSLTSTLLTWVSGGNSFDVVWGAQGFNHLTATPIPVTENSLLVENLTTDAPYQFYVRLNCNEFNNGYSSWAGPFNFTVGYCSITYTYGGTSDNIVNVVIGDMMDLNLSTAAPYYENRIPAQELVPNFEQGATGTVYIKMGSGSTQYSRIWIDFNNDGVFSADESFSQGTSSGANGTASIEFTVPADAQLGNLRLRVRGGDDSAIAANAACGTGSYGRAYDYAINIIEPTVGIGDHQRLAVKLFPNPTNDIVNVTASSTINKVTVINILGQTVTELKVNATSTSVDMSDLPSGNYFVKVSSELGNQTLKVLKK